MNGLAPDAAMLAALNGQSKAPAIDGQSEAAAAKTAEEFEAFFIGQMLSAMFQGVEAPEMFGGGPGEKAFSGMLHEEYGRIIARSGGVGIADQLKGEILRLQEESA